LDRQDVEVAIIGTEVLLVLFRKIDKDSGKQPPNLDTNIACNPIFNKSCRRLIETFRNVLCPNIACSGKEKKLPPQVRKGDVSGQKENL
jgi:hypothetical protein